MNYQNILKLTKPEKIFVIAGIILGVALDGLSSKYLMYIMPYGKDMAITWGILRISGNILKAAVFAFLVLKMIRIFRQSDFTFRRILLMVACVVWVLALVAFNMWRYAAVQNFNRYLESTNAEMNKSDLKKLSQDLPPEKKSRLGFLHAKSVFLNEGHLIEYLSIDSKPVTFSPSAEDQSNRNMILFQQTYSGFEKKIATTNSLSWLIALIGAFGFGFAANIQRNNEVI